MIVEFVGSVTSITMDFRMRADKYSDLLFRQSVRKLR